MYSISPSLHSTSTFTDFLFLRLMPPFNRNSIIKLFLECVKAIFLPFFSIKYNTSFGSDMTSRVCKDMNRNFLGCEIDKQ